MSEAAGLVVGDRLVTAAKIGQDGIQSRTYSEIAPAVLLPSEGGEPFRLDFLDPPHPRGLALNWPPESRVSQSSGAGRFPFASAWLLRYSTSQEKWFWRYGDHEVSCTPIEAIRAGLSSLARELTPDLPVAIVVPNDLRQSEQQLVLDACAASGINASLIWAPVAVCIEWMATFGDSESSRISHNSDVAIVAVESGRTTVTLLRLVEWQANNTSNRQILPARNRPRPSDTLFTAFQPQALAFPGEIAAFTTRLCESLLIESESGMRAKVLERIARSKLLSGVVIFGDVEASSGLASHLKSKLPAVPILDITGTPSSEYLARGAARFRHAQLCGKVSYLDTLPLLELFIERGGKYEWHKLLGDGQFVPGGKRWHSPEDTPIAVRSGETSVRLVLAHEEFKEVREVLAPLKTAAERRLPGLLHVSATPAQGNAVLQITLHEKTTSSELPQQLTADWRRMTVLYDGDGKPLDKATFLKNAPRSFPELLPRRSSEKLWRRAQTLLISATKEKVIVNAQSHADAREILDQIKSKVMQKDPAQMPNDATAIGSDSVAPFNSSLLDELVRDCLIFWRNEKENLSFNFNTVIRILGYVSANDGDFESWLIRAFVNRLHDQSAVAHACGHCLRNPRNIRTFVLNQINRCSQAGATDLKPISQVLRYRVDATEAITQDEANDVISKCLAIFRKEMANSAGRSFAFRWSSLIIVYMLRRRMFDTEFLPPESDLAVKAKDLFSEAIQRYEQKRLRPIGGTVDTPKALRQMIDYIDRKGVGPPIMGNED